MDEFNERIAPFRLCLLGILIYAHDRGDQRLVDAIETFLERNTDDFAQDRQSKPASMQSLLQEVIGPERIWWQKAEALARVSSELSPVVGKLADIRLGR